MAVIIGAGQAGGGGSAYVKKAMSAPRATTVTPVYRAPTSVVYSTPKVTYSAPTVRRASTATYSAPVVRTASYAAPVVRAPVVTPTPAPVSAAPTPAPAAPTVLQGQVWGAAPPVPPVLNYPTAAQQQSFNTQFGLPGTYANWFAATISPFEQYYTPERGGTQQAQADYETLLRLWQSKTGVLPTPDVVARIFQDFAGYARQLGRPAGFTDLLDYVNNRLWGVPKPPQVAYVRMGEF